MNLGRVLRAEPPMPLWYFLASMAAAMFLGAAAGRVAALDELGLPVDVVGLLGVLAPALAITLVLGASQVVARRARGGA